MEEMGGIHLSNFNPPPTTPNLTLSVIFLPTPPSHFYLHAAVEFSLSFFYLSPSSKLLPQGTLVNVSAILCSLCPPAGHRRGVQKHSNTLSALQALKNRKRKTSPPLRFTRIKLIGNIIRHSCHKKTENAEKSLT